jgi:hypothetical protein
MKSVDFKPPNFSLSRKTKNDIEPIKNLIEELVQQRLKLNEAT